MASNLLFENYCLFIITMWLLEGGMLSEALYHDNTTFSVTFKVSMSYTSIVVLWLLNTLPKCIH